MNRRRITALEQRFESVERPDKDDLARIFRFASDKEFDRFDEVLTLAEERAGVDLLEDEIDLTEWLSGDEIDELEELLGKWRHRAADNKKQETE